MAIGPLLRSALSARRLRSSLLVGIVVCLAAAGIATSLIVRAEAGERVDAAFVAADAADLLLYVEPGAEHRLRLDDDQHVLRTGPAIGLMTAELADGSDREEIELRTMPPSGSLGAPVVTAGRGASGPGELLLDAGLAEDHDIAIDATLDIVVDGSAHELRVVGLGYDFSDCFYPTCDPAHLWVDEATFESLRGGERASLMLPVALSEPSAASVIADRARRTIGDDLLGWSEWRADTRADMLVETDFFGAFLSAFGLFVLASCAVVIAGTIGARTIALRRTIGLQKALGFTPRQLSASVLLGHLAIAVVACGIGGAIATAVAPRLRIGSLRILGAGGVELDERAVLISSGIVCALVAATTLVPAWRAGATDVTSALADVPPRRRRRRPSKRTAPASAGRLPVTLWLASTTLVARPVRSLLNACAIAIAIVAAVVSVSIDRSIDVVVLEPANSGDPSDASLALPDGTDVADAEATLDHLPEVAAWFSFADDKATVDGAEVHVRALGGDPATNGFVIGEGRRLERTGEAIAGFGLMDERGWHIGERVDIELLDAVVPVTIVGWYRETEDSGHILQIRMDDYARVRPDVQPSYGVIGIEPQTPAALAAALASEFGPRARIEANDPGGTDLAPFRVALATMTMLITAVALAHLLASVITTSRERARRFAIQRALGFDARRLASEAASHGLLLGLLAAAVGVPAGWFAQRAIGDLITSEIGAGPGLAIGPSAVQITTIIVATLALVAATTVLATRLNTRPRQRNA